MTSVERSDIVAVVGTGVIGASWAALFLARGHRVRAFDPAPQAQARLRHTVADAWPALYALGAPREPDLSLLEWCTDVAEAVREAAFVQESGPEQTRAKQELVARIDEHAPAGTVVASSSSGLPPTEIQATCRRGPERVLVGHPFHPAHLIPLVEVVGGRRTAEQAVDAAVAFYRAVGKKPIRVHGELPGHVVNRLQAALWREAYSLVQRGIVTVSDVDTAITNGPGIRWAVVGPFAGQHLSGGAAGIAHTLEHLGPPMREWWADLGRPEWTSELVEQVVDQTAAELRGVDTDELSAARDRLVVGILEAKTREEALPT